MGRNQLAFFILTACMLPVASFGQPPSPVPLDPDWRLVAESEWIVQARLEAPRDDLERAIRTGEGEHVLLKHHPAEIIKRPPGDPDIELTGCSYWTGPQDYMLSPKDILALDGREVLVFVGPQSCLLQDKAAICVAEPGRAARLKEEIVNQRAIAKDFAKLPAGRPDEFEKPVKELISKMLVKETQQQSVYALQKLDPRAAPSIIRLMDDRRPLPDSHTQFLNTSGKGFEGILHYEPKIVLEALATVLGSHTDHSFGHIYNGGSEEERRQVVDAWRVYLHYQTGDKAKVQPPSPALPKQSPGGKHP